MDSITNGHSEKNQQKELKILSVGEPKKVDFNKLPFEDQEMMRRMMDFTDNIKSPNIYAIDIEIDSDGLNIFPADILGDFLVKAIQENQYESAEKICNILKEKNYSIEITDKLLTLRYK